MTFGIDPFGVDAFGGDSLLAHPAGTLTIAAPDTSVGPVLTLSYTYTPPTWLDQSTPTQMAYRWLLTRSDGAPIPGGAAAFYDSGWLTGSYENAGSFSMNLVEMGVPTDTGEGSTDSSLHYAATLMLGPTAGAATEGFYAIYTTKSFDVQWGVPTLAWQQAPPSMIATSNLTSSWILTSTRGVGQGTWEVQLTDAAGSTYFYDSGVETGTTNTYTVPYGLSNDTSYREIVQATNANGVPATPLSALFLVNQPVVEPLASGGPLQRFLQLIGFQMDIDRTYIEQLRNLSNPLTCPGNFLPQMANQLGLTYEDALGMAQMRKLLAEAIHQYKIKGTTVGIAGISTAVTGWAADVTIGTNHVLPTSAFTNTSLSTATVSGTAPTVPSGYTGGDAPTAWPAAIAAGTNLTAHEFWWVATGSPTGSRTFVTGTGQAGIPIQQKAGPFSVGVWVWLNGFTNSVPLITLAISYYDQFGNLISTNGGAAVTVTQAEWTLITTNAVAKPAGACFAALHLTSSSVTWVSQLSILATTSPVFSEAATAPAWAPPQQLEVNLTADRTNLLLNPSFENGTTTSWAASNATLATTSTAAVQVPNGNSTYSTKSCEVTATAAGDVTVTSEAVPINTELTYTATCYAQAPVTVRSVVATLLLTDASGNPVATSVGEGVGYDQGDTYDSGTNYDSTPAASYVGAVTQETVGEWVRLVVQVDPTAGIPSNATGMALQVTWYGCAAGEEHLLDAALIEAGLAIQPYFDGGIYLPSADYFYANQAAQTGPSYYYSNYSAKLARLYAVLMALPNPDGTPYGQQSPLSITGFVPMGSSVALVTPA